MTTWFGIGIAGVVAVGSFARALWLGGRRDGNIDSILKRLTEIVEDHEDRIRILEGYRPRRRH